MCQHHSLGIPRRSARELHVRHVVAVDLSLCLREQSRIQRLAALEHVLPPAKGGGTARRRRRDGGCLGIPNENQVFEAEGRRIALDVSYDGSRVLVIDSIGDKERTRFWYN